MGETERSLKERLTEHLRDVRNRAEKPITCNRHFEKPLSTGQNIQRKQNI